VILVRLGADLARFLRASYLGGSGLDNAWTPGITPDGGGVYVAGFPGSEDFPATSGSAQPVYAGGVRDGAVAVLPANLRPPDRYRGQSIDLPGGRQRSWRLGDETKFEARMTAVAVGVSGYSDTQSVRQQSRRRNQRQAY
jgi:hypothetical protein